MKVKKSARRKLADKATELAYATSTHKADYPDGKPKDEYKKALNKAYPDRSKWGKATRKGASCDVYVGTTVRSSGVDKKFPRNLNSQYGYLAKSKKFARIKSIEREKRIKNKIKLLKDGDIIIYKRNNGKGHICFFVDGKIKQGAHEKFYPRTDKSVKGMLNPKGKKFVRVYRAR